MVKKRTPLRKPDYYNLGIQDKIYGMMWLCKALSSPSCYYFTYRQSSADNFKTKLEAVEGYNKYLSHADKKPSDPWSVVEIEGVFK